MKVAILVILVTCSTHVNANTRTKVGIYQDASISIFFIESKSMKGRWGKDYRIPLKSITISEDEKSIISGDVEDGSLDFCAKDSGWVCVTGNAAFYNFAFPLGLSPKEWTRNGIKYKLLGKTFLNILGKKIEVYAVISQIHFPKEVVNGVKEPEMTVWWLHYFSEKYGLMAFGRVDLKTHQAALMYSKLPCGYGGLVNYCKEINQDVKSTSTPLKK